MGSNSLEQVKNLKIYLNSQFNLKDLGNLKYFLGIEMTRSSKVISICQRQYALQLLLEIGHLRCKTRKTPRDVNVKLAQDDGELLDDPL